MNHAQRATLFVFLPQEVFETLMHKVPIQKSLFEALFKNPEG
jgi:hypothetical protein